MKLFEVLNFYQEPIKRLVSLGFKPDDCQYLDAYNDLRRMTIGGGKKCWAVKVVSEKYHISERKVWDIIKHFETDCTNYAV